LAISMWSVTRKKRKEHEGQMKAVQIINQKSDIEEGKRELESLKSKKLLTIKPSSVR